MTNREWNNNQSKSSGKIIEYKRRLQEKNNLLRHYEKLMDDYQRHIKRLSAKISVLEFKLKNK